MTYRIRMDYPTREQIAAEVLAEMARRRISRPQLAAAVDMNYQTLSTRLSGKFSFTYDELAVIADHLDISVSTLLARAEGAA